MNRALASLATVLIFAGCGTPQPSIDETMKSFLGQSYSDLVAAWGPPTRQMQGENGGKIWTYYLNRQWTSPGQAYTTTTGNGYTQGRYHGSTIFGPGGYTGDTRTQGQSVTTYSPPQTQGYTAQRIFFINREGRIYRYSWRGK